MKPSLNFDAHSASNSISSGHPENQDTFLAKDTLFAVADGVGGYGGAKEASSIAIEGLKRRSSSIVDKESMRLCLKEIHFEVQKAAEMRNIPNMGTTIAAAKIIPSSESNGRIVTGNVGDSPILFFGCSGTRRVFVDDSHRDEDPRAIYGITQYLGLDCELVAHSTTFDYISGDYLLICSDGITDNIRDLKRLEEIVKKYGSAKRLVDEALASHVKPDDMTVILLSL